MQANLTLQGPQKLSEQTDDEGRASLSLVPGEYRIEVSAPAHKPSRTHYDVRSGGNLPFTILLAPENPPAEERPEVIASEVRPGFTLLHGYVVDANTGRPVAGVKVRFVNADVETRTDSKGHYQLSVPTPVPANPGGLGTDTLTYEKPGYKSLLVDNFGIAGEEMGGSAIDLEKGTGVVKRDALHKLMRL